MQRLAQRGFLLRQKDVVNDILVPRYYDPRITEELRRIERTHELTTIHDLIAHKQLRHDHGKYIPKIYYGLGPYPYIRTSDLANWELRASPKHGVPSDVFNENQSKQDVRVEDILFVHEGTYLIGTTAMVTPFDGPMLYQHHLAKFRVLDKSRIRPYFLLAALEAPIVKRQVRARQFCADIIDSVVGRLGEVVIPLPKDGARMEIIDDQVKEIIWGRAKSRVKLSRFFVDMETFLRDDGRPALSTIVDYDPNPGEFTCKPAFLRSRGQFLAFRMPTSDLSSDILVPKYYDPTLAEYGDSFRASCNLVSIRTLLKKRVLSLATGDEIGRLNYGTGEVPFVRTSDLGSFELKADPKQGVSTDVYLQYADGQDLRAMDILLVRDGTYLVGSSCLVAEEDLPLLFCGGIYKIRCADPQSLPPGLCLALLNMPFVQRQIRSKQFTRDVIDTIGRRLEEVLLPIPRDKAVATAISEYVLGLCHLRTSQCNKLRSIVEGLYG